jgi:anti-anti-sigma factor
MASAGSNGAVVRDRRSEAARKGRIILGCPSGVASPASLRSNAQAVAREDAKEQRLTEGNGSGAREAPVERVESVDGAVVVHLCGELDLYNASELREAFAELIAQSPERVVVDLGHVDFIDSTALGVLVEARTRLPDRRTFLLAAPGSEPRRTLEIAGIAQHVGLYDTVEAALAAPV